MHLVGLYSYHKAVSFLHAVCPWLGNVTQDLQLGEFFWHALSNGHVAFNGISNDIIKNYSLKT